MSRLKFYRLKACMTQAELAQELDVDQTTVSNWEHGKCMPVRKHRKRLCSLFGVAEEDLFPKEEEPCEN